MASSKLISRNSDLKRKLSTRASTSSDFLKIESSSGRDSIVSDSATADTYFRNAYVERNSSMDQSNKPSTLVNAEITLLDAVGAVSRIGDGETEPRRRTADDVWREILEGKKNQQKEKYPKEEEITLEDFLVKVGAVEAEEAWEAAIVEVKEEGVSGGMYSYENSSGNYSAGVIGMGVGVGMDVGGLERGRGRRSLSLMEPLDKAALQRQRRMIKNRESAARSRERKQAYQMELESMAERLEEENGQLSNEMAEHTEKRLKQIMENVIPVTERRRPPRVLRKVRSMEW